MPVYWHHMAIAYCQHLMTMKLLTGTTIIVYWNQIVYYQSCSLVPPAMKCLGFQHIKTSMHDLTYVQLLTGTTISAYWPHIMYYCSCLLAPPAMKCLGFQHIKTSMYDPIYETSCIYIIFNIGKY